jgi:hypothetical protein
LVKVIELSSLAATPMTPAAPASKVQSTVPMIVSSTTVAWAGPAPEATIHRHIAAGGHDRLPDLLSSLTYFALAPFLGPEAAAEVLTGDPRGEGPDLPLCSE